MPLRILVLIRTGHFHPNRLKSREGKGGDDPSIKRIAKLDFLPLPARAILFGYHRVTDHEGKEGLMGHGSKTVTFNGSTRGRFALLAAIVGDGYSRAAADKAGEKGRECQRLNHTTPPLNEEPIGPA